MPRVPNDIPQVVLFFTCVFYMTSHDDFLERNIGDFLPISQADRKVRSFPHATHFGCPFGCCRGRWMRMYNRLMVHQSMWYS